MELNEKKKEYSLKVQYWNLIGNSQVLYLQRFKVTCKNKEKEKK